MNIERVIKPILISIIPVLLLILNVADMIKMVENPGVYPFGGDFFPSASIYGSKEAYMVYNFIFSIILLLIIYFAFAEKTRLLYFFLTMGILMFLYPIMTTEY